jgi:large subunit ribosomal protein L4
VQIVIPDELNTYDVLVNDWLVFSKATLASAVARFGGTAEGSEEPAEGSETADEEAGEQ